MENHSSVTGWQKTVNVKICGCEETQLGDTVLDLLK